MKKSLKVKSIVDGRATGDVLFTPSPIAFLQGVDPEKGVVSDQSNQIYNIPFKGKILVFPHAVGSSVGAYVIYRMKKKGTAPKAIVNQKVDIITASGCAIAGIPLFDLGDNEMSSLSQVHRLRLDSKKSELRIL